MSTLSDAKIIKKRFFYEKNFNPRNEKIKSEKDEKDENDDGMLKTKILKKKLLSDNSDDYVVYRNSTFFDR
jgi:hypothetical protein